MPSRRAPEVPELVQPATRVAATSKAMTGHSRRMSGLAPPGRRQADAQVRARVLAGHDLDGAAMRLDELAHHRQPDAGALERPALGRAAGVERIEHLVALLRRDPGAGVGAVDYGRRAVGEGMQVDGAVARRELDGVG